LYFNFEKDVLFVHNLLINNSGEDLFNYLLFITAAFDGKIVIANYESITNFPELGSFLIIGHYRFLFQRYV
jgi:hypothetical protein